MHNAAKLAGCAAVLIALIVPAAAAPAEEPAGDDLAGIRRSLDRLVDLLEAMRYQQDTELLLRRIEMRERRIAPLEGRRRENAEELERIEENLKQLGAYRDQLDRSIVEGQRDGRDANEILSLREEQGRLEVEVERLEERGALLRQRENEIWSELQEGRREVEILDGLLLERLQD